MDLGPRSRVEQCSQSGVLFPYVSLWKLVKNRNVTCWTPFTRYNRLSNKLYNWFDNRLYRVNKHPTGWQPVECLFDTVSQQFVSYKRGFTNHQHVAIGRIRQVCLYSCVFTQPACIRTLIWWFVLSCDISLTHAHLCKKVTYLMLVSYPNFHRSSGKTESAVFGKPFDTRYLYATYIHRYSQRTCAKRLF